MRRIPLVFDAAYTGTRTRLRNTTYLQVRCAAVRLERLLKMKVSQIAVVERWTVVTRIGADVLCPYVVGLIGGGCGFLGGF